MEWLTPADETAAAEAVRWAAARREGLEIRGHGTKATVGSPVQAAFGLTLAGLSGITAYDPAELVLTAAAGTPLAEIRAALSAAGQHLPFEPPDLSALLGRDGDGTLGGLVSAGLSGARRPFAGACRDHVLGVRGIGGGGEPFRAGGQVVKNVTGFDLSKLLCGAWGTLAVLTEISLKVLPAPETQATLLLEGLDDTRALSLLGQALRSPADVSGAVHVSGGDTALRLDGPPESVRWRGQGLRDLLGLPVRLLDAAASRDWWQRWQRLEPLAAGPETHVWKLSLVPTQAVAVAGLLRQADPALRAVYDWGGGLLWVALSPTVEAARIRQAVPPGGGHATLIRAPLAVRAAGGVFAPEAPAVAALSRRLKDSFDPAGIFNPGRMA